MNSYFYRYVDPYYQIDGEPPQPPELEKFIAVKKTPRGTWIVTDRLEGFLKYPNDPYFVRQVKRYRKFVLDDSVRKHAYPTKEEAANSYYARKYRQVEKLGWQLEEAKKNLEHAEKMRTMSAEELVKYTEEPFRWED